MEPSKRFSDVIAHLPATGPLPLGDLLAAVGSRAHGAALLILALPEAIPLPLPSASAVLGVPLVAISAHLCLFGEAARLPRRLGAIVLPSWILRILHDRVAPILAWAEGVSHARLEAIASRERLLGLACLYLSMLLLLPLPFFNVPPALCLVLLAWGMLQRDGACALLGLLGTVAVPALLAGLVDWARGVLG